MIYSVKQSKTKDELRSILKLRHIILREPWNQPSDTATDELEETSINAFIADAADSAIACGRLQVNENIANGKPVKTGQIRFMAVDNNYQGKGLGKIIVNFLEERARELNLETVELQARENAVKFYENCGYFVKGKSFLLWGQIQHYLMEKKL